MKHKFTLTAILLMLCAAVMAGNGGHKRKVLVIGVDGTRADALKQEMDSGHAPNLKWLADNGFYTLDSWHEDITISGPSWSSIMCGVYHLKHGVTGNTYSGSNYNQYPYFPTHAKEIDSTFKCIQYTEWAPMSNDVYNDGWDQKIIGTDGYSQGTGSAAVGLIADPNVDLLFTYFDHVDLTGHSSGFSPANPAYNQAIDTVDVQVGRIIQAMRARPTYAQEDWLVLVVTDHGGTGTTHGGVSYAERHIWWIGYSDRGIHRQASGPQNAGNTNPPDPGEDELYPATSIDTAIQHLSPVQVDIAATALHHLIYDSGIRPENQSQWALDGKSWLCDMGLCSDKTTGISNISNAEKVSIYPNPTSDKIYIKAAAPVTVGISNLIGEEMQRSLNESETLEISTGTFAPGIYFAKIQFADGTSVTRKFVKE
jgi:hypothetical protein